MAEFPHEVNGGSIVGHVRCGVVRVTDSDIFAICQNVWYGLSLGWPFSMLYDRMCFSEYGQHVVDRPLHLLQRRDKSLFKKGLVVLHHDVQPALRDYHHSLDRRTDCY